jgi:hypothetical protein
VLAQLLAQDLHLAQRFMPLDDLVEQDLEALRLDRLGEVVVGTFLDCFDGGLDGALRRQDDDGKVAAVVFEGAQQIEAAHARHDEIADDDRWSKRGDSLEGFFPVAGGIGAEPPRAHELGQAESGAGFIFDDENPFGSAGCHPCPR